MPNSDRLGSFSVKRKETAERIIKSIEENELSCRGRKPSLPSVSAYTRYIICYGYNVNKHNSLIYIFDAGDISMPMTIMELPIHVPILFHGTFVTE